MLNASKVMAGLFLSLTVAAAAAQGADWPQWRGVNRDGLSPEKGLLAEWPAAGPMLLWKASGLGYGFASLSISGGKAYTMGARGDAEYVLALDLATQKELWATKVGAVFRQRQGDGPRSTPTVDGGLVFAVGAAAGDLVCLSASSGKEIWHKSLTTDFGGHTPTWGWSESPLVDGDRVICTPGAKEAVVVALDKKTGKVIWQTALPESAVAARINASCASCVITEAGGIRQYVALPAGGLMGVAAKDGKLLWRYARVSKGVVCTTPIVRGDYVFVTGAYAKSGSALVKLTATAAGGMKAEEVYYLDANTFGNHHGGLVLLGDYLYGGHGLNAGLPVCLEFKTGRIVWQADKTPGGATAGSGAVIAADGHLYFRYQNGAVALIEASPAGYKLQSEFNAPRTGTARAWAHPVISDGRLYLRDDDALLCYDLKGKAK